MAPPKFNKPKMERSPGIPKAPASLPADYMRARAAFQAGLSPTPPVGTFLHGNAAVMVEGPTSLAAVVRAQKDSFLVDDGVQVAGDYVDALRSEVRGIAPDSMPPVGYAAASYSYPSAAMRTGAALGSVRTMLPTANYDFAGTRASPVAARPSSRQEKARMEEAARRAEIARREAEAKARARGMRGLDLNMPQRVPPPHMPDYQNGIIENSPSEARRAMISTLMGLGGLGALDINADPFIVLYEALKANTELKNANVGLWNNLMGFFTALLPSRVKGGSRQETTEANLLTAIKCNYSEGATPGDVLSVLFGEKKTTTTGEPVSQEMWNLCARETLKAGARYVIVSLALADKLDLSGITSVPVLGEWIRGQLPTGINVNDWVNQQLFAWAPPEWQPFVANIKLLPLDLNMLGIRPALLKYLYQQVHGQEINSQWLDSLSNQLANEKRADMARAIQLIRSNEYKPNARPAPAVKLAAGVAAPWMGGPTAPAGPAGPAGGGAGAGAGAGGSYSTSTYTPPVAVEEDNTIVYAGAVAALALIGVGVYMKMR